MTAPLFPATKIEAFGSRAGGDFVASHDLEDISAMADGRPTLGGRSAAVEPLQPRADVAPEREREAELMGG